MDQHGWRKLGGMWHRIVNEGPAFGRPGATVIAKTECGLVMQPKTKELATAPPAGEPSCSKCTDHGTAAA
jgi:hypothetical protein